VGGAALGGPLSPAARSAAGTSPAGSARGTSEPRPGSIGILGGTFDPFHAGHLALARAARDQLGLARILVMPAAIPPHKLGQPISPAADRVAMIEAGIAGEPRLELSRLELERGGPSWTVDTVAQLAEAERTAGREPDLYVILSAESFAGLPTWHEAERLLELARIAVAPRAGHSPPDAATIERLWAGRADRVIAIDGPCLAVSAAAIRGLAVAGRPLGDLVPPGVADYIEAHRLYRQPEPQEDPSPVTEPAEDPRTASAATSTIPRPDGLPNRGPAAPGDERPLDMARRIVELAEDKKAADIVLLDLTGLTTLADAFVICSGGSERQLDAIADAIVEGLRAEKVRPIGREGTAASHWVLVDFGSVVVHIFTPPERDFYSLEKHCGEARTVLRVQ
jgi:nicotinate-nucleotide adenylyltransferase